MQIAWDRLDIARLPFMVRVAARWWLREFLNLLPESTAQRLIGQARQLVVVSINEEQVRLELLSGSRTPVAADVADLPDDTLTAIDRFLSSRGVTRKDIDIGLRLDTDRIFRRQLLLPNEARGALDAIVAQDLVRKTPFRPEAIYSDYAALEHEGRIAVSQWITRRQYVEEALTALKLDIEQVSFVTSAPAAAGQPAPFIALRREQRAGRVWGRRAVFFLSWSALALALLVGGLKYWHQHTALDRLDEQIAATSKKAHHVRALVDQLQERQNALLSLRVRREGAGLIDLWEEVSRLLPAHSWLTELRLAEAAGKGGEQVSMAGFSSAATSLVGIIGNSPMLFDAALTAPIAHDASEGRERFALQARVKMPGLLKEAAR